MNNFKQTIWREFWEKEKKRKPHEIIDLLVKEAVGKSPNGKFSVTDKYKIKKLYLSFIPNKTMVQLNDNTNLIDIGNIVNMTCFSSLINIEYISISYFNPRASLSDTDELKLEKAVRNSNLFNYFPRLNSIIIHEGCKGGVRSISVKRNESTYF